MQSTPHALIAYLESLPEPHILCDRHYRILAANAAYFKAYAQGGPVVGRPCHLASHHAMQPCDQIGESCPLAQAVQSRQRERVLHLHHTPHGKEYVQIELTPLHGQDGALEYFIEKMEPLPQAAAAPHALLGESDAFQRMLALVARVAPAHASVLLLGESGVGKEGVAHAIHAASPRAGQPLVVVECASLAESLFESELFGHEKGAFTGATQAKPGLVEAANGGTLFLDEVGDIPLAMQVKLLRVLESGTYRRVGSTELRCTDVRIIAATHRYLPGMVAAGAFRQDLYYRLATFPIRLPPLRERASDIALIAPALLKRATPGRSLRIADAALRLLQAQPWPGNVRELRNVLEHASLLADGDVIDATHVQSALHAGALPCGSRPEADPRIERSEVAAVPNLHQLQQSTLQHALQQHQGSRAGLARQLGISERTLYRRLQALAEQSPDPGAAGITP